MGSEMCIRDRGKWIARDGVATALAPADLYFEPQRFWQDEAGVRWPVEWKVRLSGSPANTEADQVSDQQTVRELRIVAALDDQKMRSSITYWEGLVWVYENERRIGQGYLEMTGYSH